MKRILLGLLLFALFVTPSVGQIPGPTIAVNSTPIVNGTTGRCLYDNAGKVGEQACGGAAAGLTIGTSAITSGTTTRALYDLAGVVQESASLTMSGTTVTAVNLLQTTQVTGTPKAATISANVLSFDLSTGNDFTVTSNAVASTINFNNPVAAKSNFFTVTIANNGTLFAFTWPATVRWPAGLAPTLTGTNGKNDIFTFYTPDGGTNWYGATYGQNF